MYCTIGKCGSIRINPQIMELEVLVSSQAQEAAGAPPGFASPGTGDEGH